MSTVRTELLTKFGWMEGRKSRVFKAAAIVGTRGVSRCALATAAGSGSEMDYHLVHVIPLPPEAVDRVSEPLENAEEYRIFTWTHFMEFLEAFGQGYSDERLHSIAARSRLHFLASN
jgi:hypothetical protein